MYVQIHEGFMTPDSDRLVMRCLSGYLVICLNRQFSFGDRNEFFYLHASLQNIKGSYVKLGCTDTFEIYRHLDETLNLKVSKYNNVF